MKSIVLFFSVFFSFISSTNVASASPECSMLFAVEVPFDRPTVKIVATVKRDGESFYQLTRIQGEDSWRSRFGRNSFDPQGNPQWPSIFLGPALSRILGFGPIDKNDLFVPTPETLNSRIEKFNRYLERRRIKPISIRFYSQQKPVREEYLKQFSTHTALPVAAKGDGHTIHDISFHYASVMLPTEIVRLIQIDADLAWNWFRFSEGQFIPGFPPAAVSDTVSVIDAVTSMANYAEGASYEYAASTLAPYILQGVVRLSGDPMELWSQYAESHTPLDLFRRKLVGYSVKTPPQMNPKQSLMYLRKLARLPQIAREQEFLLEMAYEHPEWADQTLQQMGLYTAASIERLLAERAAELRSAAIDYLKQN